MDDLIISKGTLKKGHLSGKIALITGSGGGIGYEAARSLLWLGVKVVIAEMNKEKGRIAESKLNKEFGEGSTLFIHTDISDERSVKRLVKKVYGVYGKVDILMNNATVVPIGAVHSVGIDQWDKSYRTNLRGSVLLISYLLPDMLQRNSGVIVMISSSGAAPYMGAYEVFKTANVELSNTLAAELEQTGIITYSIGPGIVKTKTAQKAIEKVAPLYGKSEDEFYQMSRNALLSVEEAGAGFASSVALATRYKGLEIGSMQALMDIGVNIGEQKQEKIIAFSDDEACKIRTLFQEIKRTFTEQIGDWKNRSLFERQWLMRDFKNHMGAAPEYFFDILMRFENALKSNELSTNLLGELPLDKISSYYQHQITLLKGYEKDPDRVKEYTKIMEGWIGSIDELKANIKK